MAQLASAQELANHLRQTFDANAMSQADQLLTLISGEVDRYCDRVAFTRTADDVKTVPGTDDADLALPEGPVESVSAVTITSGSTTTTVTDYTLVASDIDAVLVRDTAARAHHGGHWGGRLATVTVTYTHGYAAVPDDVKMTTLQAAARQWTNPQGLQSETFGDVSATYAVSSSPRTGGILSPQDKASLDYYSTTTSSLQLS